MRYQISDKLSKALDSKMTFRTIMVDPPWDERGAGKCKRGADKYYPLMKTHEIRQMSDLILQLADLDCHLYVWTTNNFLEDALSVMDAWAFRYITTITWLKGFERKDLFGKGFFELQNFGLGQYFRGSTEHCLFGSIGKAMVPEKKGQTIIIAPRGRHSSKPDEMYEMAEKVSPEPRLELFSRREREGWYSC